MLDEAPESSIEKIIPPLELRNLYAFESDQVKGELDTSTSILRTNINGSSGSLSVTIGQPAGGEVTVSSVVQDYDFEAKFESENGGRTLTLKEASGTAAALLANARANAIYMLDNFEDWGGQGQGYIQSNQRTDNLSGFRKAYYADWNGGDSSYAASILSSANSYRLMGGDGSQVFWKNDQSMAFTGASLMRLKVNGSAWMRYTTSRVIETISGGAQPAYPHARAFTFMAKGLSEANPFQIRVFKDSLITTSNIDSGAVKVTTMSIQPGANGWVRYTVQLDLNQDYYGWCIALQNKTANAGLASPYISIDSVALVL